jgi:hypothetical protein
MNSRLDDALQPSITTEPMSTITTAVTKLAPVPKVRRLRISIRLAHPVLQRLRQYAIAKGRKESRIIEELVAGHLATGGGRHTESSPQSPVDRLVAAINDDRALRAEEHRELLRAVEAVSLALGEFQKFWLFAYVASGAQPPPSERVKRYREVAEDIYQNLAKKAAASLREGRRFMADLTKAGQTKASGGAPNEGAEGDRQ